MNLAEAKTKFPIGSMVKVVNPGGTYSAYDKWAKDHFSREDYKDWAQFGEKFWTVRGDIGEVIAVDYHGGIDGQRLIAGVRLNGKKPILIAVEDIEPYDPPFDGTVIHQDEVVFDTGLPTFHSSNGYKVSFSGTNLIVTAHGETVSYNVEELLDEIADKCYQKSREIRLGDTVKIVDGEDCYPCYVEWLKKNLTFEQALMFNWEHTPRNGDNAKVILISPHLDINKDLYLIEVEHDDVSRLYLVNRGAIEKI